MKVIQLTDTHLFKDDISEMFGVQTNLTFQTVVKRIIAEDLADADILFLTGDLSQDGSLASYQKIVESLAHFNLPVYWIPGNHDDLFHMQQVFSKTACFEQLRQLTTSAWHFIFLDTNRKGHDDGWLSDQELEVLQYELLNAPGDKKLAIVMHHHPAPVGTGLVDHYILQNRQAFWGVLAKKPVDLIICGHVHGDYSFSYKGVRIESGPASCLQWQKGVNKQNIDKHVGYKIYQFGSDGYQAYTRMK